MSQLFLSETVDEKTPVVLENMANRLKNLNRILNSEAEIDRILSSRINVKSVTQETSSYISHLIVPVYSDGEMSTHQISIFSFWTIAGVFRDCCCLYKFNVNLASVVLFCFLIVIFFAIIKKAQLTGQ